MDNDSKSENSAGSRRSMDKEISACSIPMEKESDSAVVNRRPNDSLSVVRLSATGDDTCCIVEVRLRIRSAALAVAGHRVASAKVKAEVLMVELRLDWVGAASNKL